MEQQIREQYSGFTTQLHKRYIDDVVGAASCIREELEAFNEFVSNVCPALQFTSTISETELPFLDMINLHHFDHRIETSIHKDTDTHSYLHFSSFHPEHCTCAIPYSQFLRLRRLCSNDDDFMRRSNEMLTFFSLRGYLRASLDKDLRRVRTINCPDARHPTELRFSTIDRVPLVLTYRLFNQQIKHFIFQNFRILSTYQLTRHILSQPPVVAYKRDLSLRNFTYL